MRGSSPSRGKLAFQRHDFLAQLVVLELRIDRGGVMSEAAEHGALVVIEVGARHVRPVERDGKTARRVGRGHGEHRAAKTLRNVEPVSTRA